MKITLKNLRKIIRETLAEQTALGVMAGGGGSLDDEDQERLAYGGFLGVQEADELEEEESSENKNQ